MFLNLLKFEWQILRRNKTGYALLAAFPALGLLTAMEANFPFPGTYKNGTYVLGYLLGILSLLAIFSTTLMAAPLLFREQEARFDAILYATPVRKMPYVLSRFTAIFCVSLICYLLLLFGLVLGHVLESGNHEAFGAFRLFHYLNPFFILLLPNMFFCAAVACSVALLTRNKMLVYVSGVFIYFLYWGVSFYTNAPLMANSMPMAVEDMRWAAIADPFGMAAFFEQTYYWSAPQKNEQLLQLNGNLLLNRLLYLGISMVLFFIAYSRFRFTTHQRNSSKAEKSEANNLVTAVYKPVFTHTASAWYDVQSLSSLFTIAVRNLVGAIPFWVLIVGWLGFFSIETLSNLTGNTRLPEQFATTAVMVESILSGLPLVALMVLLYFSHDLFWRSTNCRFDQFENTTAVKPLVRFGAQWLALIMLILLLLGITIFAAVGMQLLKGYALINWKLYLSLFYLVGLPLALNAGLIISIQIGVRNKYLGIVLSGILILLLHTALGSMLHIRDPLLKFAAVYNGTYSELNGFGRQLIAFRYKMMYGLGLTGIIYILSVALRNNGFSLKKGLQTSHYLLLLFVGITLGAGCIIFSKTNVYQSRQVINDAKQTYEKQYGFLKNRPQPVVVGVQTQIDLYPSEERYEVNGGYRLINKSNTVVDTLFMYADPEMTWGKWESDKAVLVQTDMEYGYVMFKLKVPLQPGDSLNLAFEFGYKGDPFNVAASFNTIISNGSFIRISRYFPMPGYNSDKEIEDPVERKKRGLAPAKGLLPLTAPRAAGNDFIDLDMVLSTDSDQTALGIGELRRQWKKAGRNYFQYSSPAPVPFRFAVASGRYAVKKIMKDSIPVWIYYHPGHDSNINHLARTAWHSLTYCEQQFGAYPYNALRFVEISSFTNGFAGTAYPATLFIRESFGYQNKIAGNPGKDILNEMVSHELSHTWWGNAGIAPDYREGNLLMTETLAMYSELMMYKNTYGWQQLHDRVNVHQNIYLSSRSFADEEPLCRMHPDKSYLAYDKGAVVMYQLYLYLGEEKINRALRQFYKRSRYPAAAPVATDLLRELYAVASPAETAKIRELLEQVVTYDVKISKAEMKQQGKGRYALTINAAVGKYLEDGKGKSVIVPFREDLEIGIDFKDGGQQRLFLKPVNNKMTQVVFCAKEPVSVIADPDGRLLNRSGQTLPQKVTSR